jgi:putative hemolysin
MQGRDGPGPLARGVARVVVRGADAATRAVTRLLGASPTAGRERITERELRDLVAANTVMDREEQRIIDEVMAAGASLVREVMMPRTEVTFLDVRMGLTEAAAVAAATTHSRFPVVDGTHDDVVGFVHLRDLLIRRAGDDRLTVAELVRDVKRLPATKRVLSALSEMRREGHHLAVVIDEYGGTAGIVTLEDLIEELVGEIHDAHDATATPAMAGGVPAEADGRLNLADFAERTGVLLPAGPYETVGGFLMARLGRLPIAGDEVRLAGWVLRVLALEGRRVARVGLAVAPPPEPAAAPAPAPRTPVPFVPTPGS